MNKVKEAVNKIKEKVKEDKELVIYILSWVVFISVIVPFNHYLKKYFPPVNIKYFQTIFLGLITFSVPFLWNVYFQISQLLSKINEKTIDGILKREFYKRIHRDFKVFFLIPIVVILLGGLAFSHWLSPVILWIFILLFILIFGLWSTQIYEWSFRKSEVPLKKFLENKIIDEDLIYIFKELFQMKDTEIEIKFDINPKELMTLYTEKIDKGLEIDEKQEIIQKLFLIFQVNFENRSLCGIFTSNFWKKFLEWHLKLWKKYYSPSRSTYINTFHRLKNNFDIIFRKVLSEESPTNLYDFFDKFVRHINENVEEKIEVKGKEKYYVEKFLRDFCNILFEEACKLPRHHEIWDLIPYEWKITAKNLKEKIIPGIFFNNFYRWAYNRIVSATEEKYDKCLDKVAYNLFPETEPRIWAEILTFALSGYEPENRVKSFIERPRTFGWIDRNKAYWVSSEKREEEINELFKKEEEEQWKNTIELLKTIEHIFGDTFSKENIEKYLKEIETLEQKYKEDDPKYKRLQELKTIFKGIKNE